MNHPPIVLGLWPIAGVTTIGVTERDAHATIDCAIESGIRTFDTAFSYGYDGDSDRILGQHLQGERERFHVIGKVGQRWTDDRQRVVDGTPTTLEKDAELSLKRMGIDSFDLLMLHSPDPDVPIERSAAMIAKLRDRGLCASIGVCNVTVDQLDRFRSEVPCDAIQCPLNLLQRDSLHRLIPSCHEQQTNVFVFWTLMKGLLAGRIGRKHVFADGDSRPQYPVFQGAARERAHRVLDGMQRISKDQELTIAQLSIGWTLSQPGVTHALVGAHKPDQVRETAASRALSTETINAIDALVDSASSTADH